MEMTKEYRKIARRRGFWMGLALFLLGIVIGVLCSPAKNGLTIGSNNRIGSKSLLPGHDCEEDGPDADGI